MPDEHFINDDLFDSLINELMADWSLWTPKMITGVLYSFCVYEWFL